LNLLWLLVVDANIVDGDDSIPDGHLRGGVAENAFSDACGIADRPFISRWL
jgi:hypothetical protein